MFFPHFAPLPNLFLFTKVPALGILAQVENKVAPVGPEGTGGDWNDGFRNHGEVGMSWLRVHAAVLSGVVLASSAAFVRADCGCAAPASAPCAAPAAAPATRTVTVQEWVPEKYQTTRTVYKTECAQENYTAYRTECVAQQQTQQVTVYKSVCETHNEVRTVCRCVPSYEERTVMKQVVTCVPATTYTHRCVDKGHWECRQVECGPTFMERMHKKFHHKDCCECQSECECPHYRTERVWVSCKVEECVPCTHMVRHVQCVPCTEKVCCFKHVAEQVTVPVTSFKCVPQVVTQTCTVMVPHQVAYQACRTVSHCVPCQETVTCCRMVCHTVEKQVACEAPCATTCGCENSCGCESGCRRHKFHFGGHKKCHESCGCETASSGCGCN